MSDLEKAKRLANIANLKVSEYENKSKTADGELIVALESARDKYKGVGKDELKEEDVDQFMQVMQNLASCQSEMKKYDDALATLDDALKLDSLKNKNKEIKELKIIALTNKVIDLGNDLKANADEIIKCVAEGTDLDKDNETLHYYKARAHNEKGELEEAIKHFNHTKNSSLPGIADYTKDIVKALLTKLAIDHINDKKTFTDFVKRSEIGDSADAFLKVDELAERVKEYACHHYHNKDQSEACKLTNALIGQGVGAESELCNMVSNCEKPSSELLGQINSAADPLADSAFDALSWS